MPPSRAISTRPLSSVIPPKTPVKRHRLTLQDRLNVIKFCEEHPHLTDDEAASLLRRRGYLTLSQSSVWRLKKSKDKLQALAQNPNELQFKRIRQVEYPDVDQALQKWILQEQRARVRPSGDTIRAKARHFAKLFGHPEGFLSLSGGWLTSLKARMGLRQSACATELTELENTVPMEQEWTDEEIVGQVRAEMRQAEDGARGEALHDAGDDDAEGGNTNLSTHMTEPTPGKSFVSRDDALASLHMLQDYISHLNEPSITAFLPFLHELGTQIRTS